MTIDEIKRLVEVVRETGISELEVEMKDGRVKISNAPPPSANPGLVVPVSVGPAIPGPGMPAVQHTIPGPVHPPQEREEEKRSIVKSPIVGTYYDSPSPGAPPFVNVGDRVTPKQVLCIIESMKLMNEIEAEIAGLVVAKHVENGRPIEYGEALFTLQPD